MKKQTQKKEIFYNIPIQSIPAHIHIVTVRDILSLWGQQF